MANFTEALNIVKEHIKTLMTKENIKDNELNDLATLNKQVDELGIQHQELVDSHSKMKDKYIEAITNFGTPAQPKEEKQGKTFEEIANEIVANRSKD